MTKSAHCKLLLESLSDYVDGTLSEELCAEIQRHISACQNCSIVVDTLPIRPSAQDHLSLSCDHRRAGKRAPRRARAPLPQPETGRLSPALSNFFGLKTSNRMNDIIRNLPRAGRLIFKSSSPLPDHTAREPWCSRIRWRWKARWYRLKWSKQRSSPSFPTGITSAACRRPQSMMAKAT